MDKINELEQIIYEYANKICAPKDILPVFGLNDFAIPYIEIDSDGNYNYIIRERGKEYRRLIYTDKMELLYKVFEDITFSMGISFELKNRIENQSFRIIVYAKQEELLGILNEEWAIKQSSKNKIKLEQ